MQSNGYTRAVRLFKRHLSSSQGMAHHGTSWHIIATKTSAASRFCPAVLDLTGDMRVFQKLPFNSLVKVTTCAERYDRSSLSDHDGNAGTGIIQRDQNLGHDANPLFLHRQVHRFLPFPSSPSFTSLPSAPLSDSLVRLLPKSSIRVQKNRWRHSLGFRFYPGCKSWVWGHTV